MIDAPERARRRDSRTIRRLGQLEAEVGEADAAARYLVDAATLQRERLGVHHPDTIAAQIEAAAVTRDRAKKARLAGEAFANAVSGNAHDQQRLDFAAHAMTLLTELDIECTESDSESGCTELEDVRATVERALADAGREAKEASRIAKATTDAVHWSWTRRETKKAKKTKPNAKAKPPKPPGPPELGPSVRIGFGDDVFDLVVTDGNGARIEVPKPPADPFGDGPKPPPALPPKVP